MVHQYQLNGYNIVLDTCSGSVHVVDDVAYDVIAMYADHTPDEIVSAMMEKYGDREDVTEEDRSRPHGRRTLPSWRQRSRRRCGRGTWQ